MSNRSAFNFYFVFMILTSFPIASLAEDCPEAKDGNVVVRVSKATSGKFQVEQCSATNHSWSKVTDIELTAQQLHRLEMGSYVKVGLTPVYAGVLAWGAFTGLDEVIALVGGAAVATSSASGAAMGTGTASAVAALGRAPSENYTVGQILTKSNYERGSWLISEGAAKTLKSSLDNFKAWEDNKDKLPEFEGYAAANSFN